MPMTSGMYAMGKIVGPLASEFQTGIAGDGLMFYTLLIAAASLMFTVIVFNKHLRQVDHKAQPLLEKEETPTTKGDDLEE